jgi:hypothetical protein
MSLSLTKPQIYNLTLSALLLGKEVVDPVTDKSSEVRILNLHWNVALYDFLADLDLDSLATSVTLELIEELDETYEWTHAYKYPSNCAFFRRIKSGHVTDNVYTHIDKKIGVHGGFKAIFTNEPDAVAEILPDDFSLGLLSAPAGMALAYKIAELCAPLIVGKGARTLVNDIRELYVMYKMKAQEIDAAENFRYENEALRSEFVQARTE